MEQEQEQSRPKNVQGGDGRHVRPGVAKARPGGPLGQLGTVLSQPLAHQHADRLPHAHHRHEGDHVDGERNAAGRQLRLSHPPQEEEEDAEGHAVEKPLHARRHAVAQQPQEQPRFEAPARQGRELFPVPAAKQEQQSRYCRGRHAGDGRPARASDPPRRKPAGAENPEVGEHGIDDHSHAGDEQHRPAVTPSGEEATGRRGQQRR